MSNNLLKSIFFDFDKDIYKETIEVQLLDRLRDEQKFDSVEALKLQLHKDQKISLDYIKNTHV